MAEIYKFPKLSYEEHGYMEPLPLRTGPDKKAVPHIRIIKIGDPPKHGNRYLDILLLGFYEIPKEVGTYGSVSDLTRPTGYTICGSGSLPIGIARYLGTDQELLKASVELKVTVRRTVRSSEMIVYMVDSIPPAMMAWASRLKRGMIFNANKVALAPQCLPIDKDIRFRVVFVNGTSLGSITIAKVPKTLADLALPNSISVNLMVSLKTGASTESKGIIPTLNEKGDKVLNFMVHLGLIHRKVGRVYSMEYCKGKIEKMRLIFSLGLVGGISFHVQLTGVVSKSFVGQLGGKKEICYPLMDVNPHMNLVIWAASVEITGVDAVFQPSIPRDFKYYPNVVAKNIGKIKA
nr:matrix protein [Respirovirus suis]UQS35877.1 matrix protein [Respirovirus suis]UQS35889.1 matrix protein [Respirovirus suis]UQS35937.1 matrix protein [Respirovirus suis]